MNARKKVANGPENHGGNERLQEYTAWDGTGYGRQGREVVGRMVGRARRQTMSVQGSSATSSLSFGDDGRSVKETMLVRGRRRSERTRRSAAESSRPPGWAHSMQIATH